MALEGAKNGCGMEILYQYLWQYKMLGRRLRLASGAEIEVLDPGRLNTDAGPDFFNAKIKVGDKVWAGNVEIHVKASDWYRHGHQDDTAYDSVMLHVVAVDDRKVYRTDGSEIPQVSITMPRSFFEMYRLLAEGTLPMRCAGQLWRLDRLHVADWMETLGMERLQVKAERIRGYLEETGHDWQHACLMALARSLGFGLNGLPFEMLARSLSLNYLGRHSDSVFQLEAMLFGQAGMLDMSMHMFDDYYQRLCREYYFLARKYGMRPMRADMWKYARLRPQSFPHRRIALLVRALSGGFSLMGDIIDAGADIDRLRALFSWKLDGYWANHFDFDVEASSAPLSLGKSSVDLLLVNLVAPVIYLYHGSCGNYDAAERAVDLLRGLRPESNSIITAWRQAGIEADDAFTSQALLHLRKEYCDARKCLYCRFGNRLLRQSQSTPTPNPALFPES